MDVSTEFEQEETRKTTLFEYIEACHDLVFTKLTVETNKEITSKGSITSPAGRRCPSQLEPWVDFLEEQRVILGTVFSKFPARTEAFKNRSYLRTRGDVIAERRVGDEDALKLVLEDLVVEPVTSIIERLQDEDGVKAKFNIGAGIAFETRVNALGDTAQGSAERPRTPDGKRLRPDQICAYKRDDGGLAGQTMAYIIEYKAPHKLTLPHLRLGLRPMNIYEDVINRATRPVSDEAAVFQYHADRLAAAAVTQTFDYMIQAGLTYGCLTTGEGFVFLKIDWTHPITLLYHLAEPVPEVDEHRDNFLCCTAVSQMLAFTVLALDSQTRQDHGQDDRRRAIKGLKTWAVDWESILQSIPLSERTAPPTSPAYKPRTYKGADRSPYLLRQTKARAAGRRDCKASPASRDPSPESDDDGGETRIPGTPTPAQPRKALRDPARRPRGNNGDVGPSPRSSTGSNRQYCTQTCLLDRRHPVDHAAWLGLLHEQLGRTLDDGIVPLGKQGARGVLFQVTLLAYGYTFVSKATTARFVPELEHESKVYEHLRPLQGIRVPVFLGAVDLREVGRTYYYDIQVHIIYLVFLSWGGRRLGEIEVWDKAKVKREVIQSVRALHVHGVVHTDVRDANVLWNEEMDRAMVIDFEQAVLAERPQSALAPVMPNKRARRTDVDTNTTAGKLKSKRDATRLGMQDDILAAKMIFFQHYK
ncbi:hypothetical protein C7999DRAFT_41034 [Corynascus novoguineensis]|uniref:non-specific serine/threonine protein kinase n=1 Tax=Corynascus novoguineensis TaxID=1126955 RepID=A0AAN7CSU2_9PEZI|nr:hypothetical protein C7999DRAFT_41034 [Corynascus novoguineensis]